MARGYFIAFTFFFCLAAFISPAISDDEADESGDVPEEAVLLKKWSRKRSLVKPPTRSLKIYQTRGMALMPMEVQVEPETEVAFRVQFVVNSTTLVNRASALESLEKAAKIIQGLPNEKFIVVGHTCDLGSEKSNLKLSDARAQAIRNILTGAGVKEEQLIAGGVGEEHPEVPNTSEENRKKNRRVMVVRRPQ